MKYRLASGPIYPERLPRCNIFFSQVIETLVGSNVHQQDGRQAVMALSDLRVLVAAIGEEAIHSLFDYLNLYGLSCFHLGPIYQPPRDLQGFFRFILFISTGRKLRNSRPDLQRNSLLWSPWLRDASGKNSLSSRKRHLILR